MMIPAFALLLCGGYAAYVPTIRNATWYPWLTVFLAASTGWIWGVTVRRIPDSETVFRLSMCFDALAIVAYVVVPILVLGVKPTNATIAGVGFILLGTVLVKVGS